MELKINIAYHELFEAIKQLPTAQFMQLQADLANVQTEKKPVNQTLRHLLLNGPVMTAEQYEQYQDQRKWMNQWRTKI